MDNILKFAVIAYLVHNNSQLKDYYDAIKLFNQIDEDENGKISKEELQYYLESEGEKLKNDIVLIFLIILILIIIVLLNMKNLLLFLPKRKFTF